ncbi:helix-turn-helix domain-containing protein [Pseudomonas edaphica]|uniref:Helix-turn-helix domain-containing protein n=1 Tax=Pseudomonas edaphica TaxID=2006980 RepID=A0ABY2U5D6_9PSED|nr:helix-turn-helix domain-containing protein [Pseudomonas edaphica]TLG91252.1 helix-turn-helix domain-containing protein [Pseudomonas edaphica]
MPISGEQELILHKEKFYSNRQWAIVLTPFERQQLTLAENCRQLHVAIPHLTVMCALENILLRKVSEPVRFFPRMDAENGASGSWWRMVRHVFDEVRHCSQIYQHVAFSRPLEMMLINGLLLSHANNYSEELLRQRNAELPRYIVRVRAFIHDHARERIYLKDIEKIAGVSRAKLFGDFKQYLNSSPMAYLKKFRLFSIRREILSDTTSLDITTIAMNWGVGHLGRFSSEYRKLFNEVPSCTLKHKIDALSKN